jgi:hypothetical protein
MKILLAFALACALFPRAALADDRSECEVALVEATSGKVELIGADGHEADLEAGQAVERGDLVSTGAGAWADLRLCDGSGLRVGESSKFYYESAESADDGFLSWAFHLVKGTLRAAVVGEGNGERVKLRVRTPTASLGVRGTELVIDADDSGEGETSLHTLEGEVLMGPASDFDKLGQLRGAELTRRFEPVGREKMSRIRRNEARPRRATAFRLEEFRARRQGLLGRPLPKMRWEQLRGRFQKARQGLRERRASRGLFERPREKIEERVGGGGRAERLQKRRELRRERRGTGGSSAGDDSGAAQSQPSPNARRLSPRRGGDEAPRFRRRRR